MNKTPIFVADAFVGEFHGRVLRGNPAAVALLTEPREDAWMQEVAAEMNLSETAFLVARSDVENGAADFDLRWFTPLCEVDLCGHATLASAHILWESGRASPSQPIRFHTRSGILGARREGDWIWLDFPAQTAHSCAMPRGFLAALELESEPENGGAPEVFRAGEDLILPISEAQVKNCRPDFAALRAISTREDVRGIIVTAPAEWPHLGYDFASRFFGPAVGIDEDPVTGSAHTSLAPFWGARLGKNSLSALQLSARGGWLRLELRGERVLIGGCARTALRGSLLI